MRRASERLADLLKGPQVTYRCRVEAWYGGKLTLESVPVTTGHAVFTAGVIETVEVSLSVPVGSATDVLDPSHPLAAYGQRLRIFIEVTDPIGAVESVSLGWFRIESSPVNGDFIDITARDLAIDVQRARMVTPAQIVESYPTLENPDANPLDDVLTFMLTGIVPVAVLDNLPNVSGSIFCERDRYAKIQDLLTVAGAWSRIDMSGTFVVMSADDLQTQTADLTLSDGVDGTLVELQPGLNASAGYNACIVQGVTVEGAPVFGGEFLKDGAMAWPIGTGTDSAYGANPGFYFSALLKKPADCRRVAESLLKRWNLGSNGTFSATCGPDPRLETYDAVMLSKNGTPRPGLVQSVELPLTATSGDMQVSGVLL